MNDLAATPTKAAIADLRSTTCACGARKTSRQTFCRRDYFRLPVGMREALYARIGEGYEAHYAAALKFLELESPALKAMESEAAK